MFDRILISVRVLLVAICVLICTGTSKRACVSRHLFLVDDFIIITILRIGFGCID